MRIIQRIQTLRERFESRHHSRIPGPLRVEAGKIVCADRAVRLTGTSLFWSNLQPDFFVDETVKWLARDWRLNVLRVPIGVAPEGAPMKLSEAVALAKRAIDAAILENIYVVIDWHAHDQLTEAASCLAGLADHYGDMPNILYEPWNEPNPGFDWSTIRAYHETIVDAVRASAPSALIIAGTPDHSRRVDIAALAPVARSNVTYALHFYAGTHREGLRAHARTALSAGLVLLASEWGPCEANGDGVIDWSETKRWIAFLDEHGIGDIAWAVSAKREACSFLQARATATGEWRRSDLKPVGRFHRARLRAQATVRDSAEVFHRLP